MEKPKVHISKRELRVYGVRRPTPVEIVCGDCSARTNGAGDAELLPYRTFLAMDGRCYTCGGRSFVIASELCGALRRTITERRKYALTEGFAIGAERRENAESTLWPPPDTSEVLAARTVTSPQRREPDLLPELATVN